MSEPHRAATIRLILRPCEEVVRTGDLLAVRLTRAEARMVYRSLSRFLGEDEKLLGHER